MTLSFTKMHGAGNDFVVVDATRTPFRPTPELLGRLTDRRYGVGCDQVLVVEAPSSPDVDFNYRIFNADGSEVGQCGNGARCLARFVREQGLSQADRLRVRTAARVLTLEHMVDGHIRVNLGLPDFAAAAVPLALPDAERYSVELPGGHTARFQAVSMGNPHAVITVDDVDRAPVAEWGAALQALAVFPESVNVGFMQVMTPSEVRLRVYERGVGETLACGSGACAAVVCGIRAGMLQSPVTVQVPGGRLAVTWASAVAGEAAPVWLEGDTETVFRGELS
jgi:diaminopimelate epimerase